MPDHPPSRLLRLTPPGRGALASLLVEGPGAVETVAALFHARSGRPLESTPPDRPVVGHFGPPGSEEVVVCWRPDRSVELHCHGGHTAIARIEALLVEQGAEVVSWQDWATRHHADPITAAARIALAEARTERTALILLDQYGGALRRAIGEIQAALHRQDASAAGRQLDLLLERAELGRRLVEPWRVVLAGRPNVGKSSLINALVGYQRAIVHATPGTTRDVVTAAAAVDGWPVELADTAGLRAGGHPIEQAGVGLARQKMAAADLVILVFDASRPWSDADRVLSQSWPGALRAYNKADLAPRGEPHPRGVTTSALTGEGIDSLVHSIAARLVPNAPAPGAAVPFTPEQVRRLRKARETVAEGRLEAAAGVLTEL